VCGNFHQTYETLKCRCSTYRCEKYSKNIHNAAPAGTNANARRKYPFHAANPITIRKYGT